MTVLRRPVAAVCKPDWHPSTLLQRLLARLDGWLRGWLKRCFGVARLWRRRPRQEPRDSRPLLSFEALEPRVLMSADLALGAAVGGVASSSQVFSAGAAPTLNLTPVIDADGTRLSLDISGPGTAQLVADGSGFALLLADTDTSTQINLQARGGDGRVTLTAIHAMDDVGSLALGAADLHGDAIFGGKLASLVVGDIRDARIEVAGAGEVRLQAAHLMDSQLQAPQASLTVRVGDWLSTHSGASRLDVAAVRSLVTTGDFDADLAVSGQGGAPYALGSVQIGGTLAGGQWSIQGRGSSLQAGSTGSAWRANLSGTLVQFITRGEASGALSVAALQLLQTGGSAQNFTLRVGADLGDDSAPGGMGSAGDSFRPGTLGRVRIAGDLVGSQLLVSLDPVNELVGDGDDQQLGSSAQRLQEFVVGGQMSGSIVVAPDFPASIRIGGVTQAPASLPALFARTPADQVAPLLGAQLADDTGSDPSDTLTRDPAVRVHVVEAGSLAGIEASFGAGFQAIGAVPQGDGDYLVDAAALALLNGGSLPDGAYTLQLRARDAAGNVGATTGLSFTLATRPPELTELGLDPLFDTGLVGDLSTAADVVTLVGRTSPAARIQLDPSGRLTTADASGAFRFAAVDLLAGFNTFDFTVIDAAGNLGTASLTIERGSDAGDTVSPTLAAALQSDTGTLITDGITLDPTIAGQVHDNLGVVRLMVALDPGASPVLGDLTRLIEPDGRFTLTPAELAALAGGQLGDGAHRVLIQAIDAAGNVAERTVRFTLDTLAPTLGALGLDPASDSGSVGDLSTTFASVSLIGSSTPGDRIHLVQGNRETTVDSAGRFHFDAVPLVPGSNLFDFSAVDAAGNRSTGSLRIERTLVPDSTPPNLLAGLANDTGSADGITRDPTITGQTSDNIAVTRLWVSVAPEAGGVFTDLSSLLEADGRFTLSAAQLASLARGPLADGFHQVLIEVGDEAGNATQSSVPFTLATTAPVITEFGFDADLGDGSTHADSVAVTGLTRGGAVVRLGPGNLETIASPGGAFRFEGVALELGSNLFDLSVTDGAGNTTGASLTIVRTVAPDTSAPTLTAALLDDTGLPDGVTRDPRLQLRAGDDVAVRRFLVALDPGPNPDFIDLTALIAAPDGSIPASFIIDPRALAQGSGGSFGDGEHRILLRAVDAAGNAGDAEVLFTLDRSAPLLGGLALDPASDSGVPGDLSTTRERITLTGRASPGDHLTLSGAGGGEREAVAGADGGFAFTDIALPLGSSTFTFRNVDLAGNATEASLTVERTVAPDTSAPTLTAILSSDTGSSAQDGITSIPAISGAVSDDVGLARLLLAVDPLGVPSFIDISADVHAGTFRLDAARLATLARGTLVDGPHAFLLRAVDAAGNAAEATVHFTLDSAVPSISQLGLDPAFDTGSVGDGSTTEQIVTVIGQTEPGAFVRVVQLNAGTTADASGSFSIGGISLEPGSNNFDFTVIDAAGNGSLSSLTLERTTAQ